MKKKLMFLVILTMVLFSAQAFADDTFGRNKMPINVDVNPISISGTYEIDQMVIMDNGAAILNSEDDYSVNDDKGEATILFSNSSGMKLDIVYKMQMSGPVFKKGSALAQYAFIYNKKSISLAPKEGEPLSATLAKAGLQVVDHEDIILTIPLENGRIIKFILEKDSDKVKNLTNDKYLIL